MSLAGLQSCCWKSPEDRVSIFGRLKNQPFVIRLLFCVQGILSLFCLLRLPVFWDVPSIISFRIQRHEYPYPARYDYRDIHQTLQHDRPDSTKMSRHQSKHQLPPNNRRAHRVCIAQLGDWNQAACKRLEEEEKARSVPRHNSRAARCDRRRRPIFSAIPDKSERRQGSISPRRALCAQAAGGDSQFRALN